MTRCSAGDVILVRFPFTDLASSKKRPALVLSPAEYFDRHHDVVVLALSSQPQPEEEFRLQAWKQAGLPKPSWFKPIIATLSMAVVVRKLGVLADADLACAARVVAHLIADPFLA